MSLPAAVASQRDGRRGLRCSAMARRIHDQFMQGKAAKQTLERSWNNLGDDS